MKVVALCPELTPTIVARNQGILLTHKDETADAPLAPS